MADLTVTPASVVSGAGAATQQGIFGATVTAGQVVYQDANSLWQLADNDSVTTSARRAVGIALNGGAVNQPAVIQTAGPITIGATLTAGTDYYLSANPGGICPRADIVSGKTVCLLGLAASTTVLNLGIEFPNVTL